MGFWTKAILATAAVAAGGAAWVWSSAHALNVTLVPERASRGNLIVEVNAERSNIYSRPWDGVGHVGGLVGPLLPSLNLESPPDMMLCVVTAEKARCHAEGTSDTPVSYCHDSFRCKWQVRADRSAGFALVVFDLDIVNGRSVSDLVDIVAVTGIEPLQPAAVKRVRALIEHVSPTAVSLPDANGKSERMNWRPGEAQRRARPFAEAPAGYCLRGCELEQSTVALEWL